MNLVVSKIIKNFGAKEVLKEVSFEVGSGKALGLLGRNGAGKTTAIRTIMNVFPPDAGEILLDDNVLRHTDARIGYLPEEKGLYPKTKIRNQLIYLAELRGLGRKQATAAVIHWLDRLEMSDVLDKKLETLSKGNQQKIQLAAALLTDPDIIILDEPFTGLDPVNAEMLKAIVREQVRAGKIVLFSSHQMNYVEEFCDDIAILHGGKIVLSGDIREIKRGYVRNRIAVSLVDRAASARLIHEKLEPAFQQKIIRTISVEDDGCIVELFDTADRDLLLQAMVMVGLSIEQFAVVEPTLEEIFIEKTRDAEISSSEEVVS